MFVTVQTRRIFIFVLKEAMVMKFWLTVAIVLSTSIVVMSIERPPKGMDTRKYCRKLSGKSGQRAEPEDDTIKGSVLMNERWNCYYYPRCNGSSVEYKLTEVPNSDFLDSIRETTSHKYYDCLQYKSIFCHEGLCDLKDSLYECTKGNPVAPPEEWPCLDDYKAKYLVPQEEYKSDNPDEYEDDEEFLVPPEDD